MNDSAMCACLRILYQPIKNQDGTYTSRWVCQDCGAVFIKNCSQGTNDLPTRLRELTQDLIQCSNQLINHAQQKMEDKNFEHFDKWMTRVEKMLPVIDEAPGWANELEKEKAGQ